MYSADQWLYVIGCYSCGLAKPKPTSSASEFELRFGADIGGLGGAECCVVVNIVGSSHPAPCSMV